MGFTHYSGESFAASSYKIANKNNRKFLVLMVTGACNLCCTYCYQGRHETGIYMSFDTAKKAIDDFFLCMEKEKIGVIDFIGGEPFLAVDLLTQVASYVASEYGTKRYIFNLTTNGTIDNDKVRNWILSNKDKVYITVSIDGDKETHDRNRCMSYDKAASFLSYLISVGMRDRASIKMTIGPNSIGSIFKGICELHKFGVDIFSNVVYENVWGNEKEKAKSVSIFRQELAELIKIYLNDPTLPHNSLVSLPIKNLVEGKHNVLKWCGSGTTMMAIDVNGKKYPCHRAITEGVNLINPANCNDINSAIVANKTNNRCASCVFIDACPHCEVLNLSENGSESIRTSHHCEFIKSQLVATAQLAYQKLKDKLESELTLEELQLLRGVLFIKDHIKKLLVG